MIFLRVMKIPDNAMPGWLPPAEATRIRVAQQKQTLQKQSTVPFSRGLLHCHPKDPVVGTQKPAAKSSFFDKKSASQT